MPPSPAKPARDTAKIVREARALVQSRATDISPALDLATGRVERFFDVRFARVDKFVDELFCWRGKWRSAFWSREDYERYARRAFERIVLRLPDFEREVLDPARGDFAFAAEASENRTLADVSALVRVSAPDVRFEALEADVRSLLRDVAPAIAEDGAMNVLSIAGSEAGKVTGPAIRIRRRWSVSGARRSAGPAPRAPPGARSRRTPPADQRRGAASGVPSTTPTD